jgi:phosphoglucomutase
VVNIAEDTQKEHFASLMGSFRNNPPSFLGNYNLKMVLDYKRRTSRNLITGKKLTLNFPVTNMIQLYLSEGTSITFVPTENKMYHYISMAGSLGTKEEYQEVSQRFDEKIFKFVEAINKL